MDEEMRVLGAVADAGARACAGGCADWSNPWRYGTRQRMYEWAWDLGWREARVVVAAPFHS